MELRGYDYSVIWKKKPWVMESFHDQGAHCATRDISSEGDCARASAPVKFDIRRYLNSLKGMI